MLGSKKAEERWWWEGWECEAEGDRSAKTVLYYLHTTSQFISSASTYQPLHDIHVCKSPENAMTQVHLFPLFHRLPIHIPFSSATARACTTLHF